jgi:hypothetical protein
VGDLVRALLGVVRDHHPTAHQHLERPALHGAPRPIGEQLALRPPRPRPLGGHQPQQEAAHRVALVGAEPGDQPIGVAAQRAADAAQRGERLGADRPRLDVARVPQLGQRELEQRQPARRVLGLLDQVVDQRLGLVRHALGRRRPDDHLADPLAGDRRQEVERAGHLLAEHRQRRGARQEVGPAARQDADRRRAHGERRQRDRDHPRLIGIGQREQLLELIHEQEQAARRSVARDVAADRARHLVGGRAQQRGEPGLVHRGPRGERRGERAHRVAARQHVDARPAVVLDQPRHRAGPAQRRLAVARVAADQDERLGAHAIDELADLLAAAEEQRAVRGVERGEAAVGVAVGELVARGRGRALLERDQERVRRRVARARIALDQAIDDRRQRRIDGGHHVAEPGDVAVLDHPAELRHRDAAVRRRAGQELVQQDPERVQIRAAGRGLAAPHLGRHVERRPRRVRPHARRSAGQAAQHGLPGAVRRQRIERGVRRLDDLPARQRHVDRREVRGRSRPIARALRRRRRRRHRHRHRHRERILLRAAVHDPRQPEIEQLGAALVGQDRVRRLDVAVEHAAAMRGGEPAREVDREIQRLPPRHRALDLIERAPAHVLGHQVRVP